MCGDPARSTGASSCGNAPRERLTSHIGARVSGAAGAGEVLVSSTVRDLVAGSGIQFEDRGEHELRVSRAVGGSTQRRCSDQSSRRFRAVVRATTSSSAGCQRPVDSWPPGRSRPCGQGPLRFRPFEVDTSGCGSCDPPGPRAGGCGDRDCRRPARGWPGAAHAGGGWSPGRHCGRLVPRHRGHVADHRTPLHERDRASLGAAMDRPGPVRPRGWERRTVGDPRPRPPDAHQLQLGNLCRRRGPLRRPS